MTSYTQNKVCMYIILIRCIIQSVYAHKMDDSAKVSNKNDIKGVVGTNFSKKSFFFSKIIRNFALSIDK